MGTPLYPKNMATEWMNLKKKVNSTFTSANMKTAFAKIGAGVLNVFTALVIEAGASMRAKYQSGNTGVYFGTLEGELEEGLSVLDNTGNYSFISFSRISDGYGYTAIYDKSGNQIVASDGDSEFGLARPWIPYTFVDTTEITTPPAARQTGLTTDVTVISTLAPVQHPKMRMEAYIYIQTGGATCNYKVKEVFSGTTLFSGTSSGGFVGENFDVEGLVDYGNNVYLEITIRRASGSGNVGITVFQLMGRQS